MNNHVNKKTKVADLINEYPFIKDYLLKLSPKYKNLNNPITFRVMGKFADIEMIAQRGGFELEDFIAKLDKEIDKNKK